MSKRLVAYFSASGVTAKVAENLADAIGADIFEIQPEVPYTKADLNWMDKKSRSTIEMSDPTSRPAIAAKRDNMDEYDTIFVGFVINIIHSLKNKLYAAFCIHCNNTLLTRSSSSLLYNDAIFNLCLSNFPVQKESEDCYGDSVNSFSLE